MPRFVKEIRHTRSFVSWDSLEGFSTEASNEDDLFKPMPVDDLAIFSNLRRDGYCDVGPLRFSHIS